MNERSWNRYAYTLNNPLVLVDPDGRTVKSALALIRQHRTAIIDSANRAGITPLQLAGVVFQENRNDKNWIKNDDRSAVLGFGGPEVKNWIGRALVVLGNDDRSLGIAEMKVSTAARLQGLDPASLSGGQRVEIVAQLENPETALTLAAAELRRLKDAAGGWIPDALLLSRYNSGDTKGGVTEVGARSGEYTFDILDALHSDDDGQE